MSNVIFFDDEEKIRPWDGNAGPTLPDGEYLFEIVEAKSDLARTGTPVIAVKFRVSEGEMEGTDFSKKYVIKSDKDAAIGRTLHFLRVCGLEKDAKGGYNLDDLVSKRIYATIRRQERQMVNQTTGDMETRTMADLVGERPYDEASDASYQEQAPAPAPAASTRRPVATRNGSAAARR